MTDLKSSSSLSSEDNALQDNQFCVAMVTAPDDSLAAELSKSAVEAGLAACASRTPVRSVYLWENKVHDETEVQLFFKTTKSKYKSLEQMIVRLHPYEVPEIICLNINDGLSSYLGWIQDSTKVSTKAD